jgi:type II secretory pathway component PulF
MIGKQKGLEDEDFINEAAIPKRGDVAGEINSGLQAVTTALLVTQERIRAAVVFLLLLVVTGIVTFAAVQSTGPRWANSKDWLQIVLPTMTAFLGSALGFYFSGVVSITPRR